MTCHREHIDNQREREVRDCRDDTRQQPRNPSLFLRQSSLSVNNKMSSYQAAVEFDSNQESSDSDLSETILVNNREIPATLCLSRNQMHSTHNQKVLPWMNHWQTTIGSPNTAEKYRRPNRGTRRYKTDLIISKVWTLGKQLIRIYLTAIV